MTVKTRDSFADGRVDRVARELLDRFGDRWSALVVYTLHDAPLRFSELKDRIDLFATARLGLTEISHKVLADVLRGLRRDGLVTRIEPAEGSTRVEYGLTDLGLRFWGPMMAIHDFVQLHLDEIMAARQRFDEAQGELGDA